MVAGAVRAELARRNIVRRDAVAALMEGSAQQDGGGLGRTASYERIAGLVPFSWSELEILSLSFEIPLEILSGSRAPDVAAVRV
ncbi:hypothetical protein CLV49_0562 [Labedella gwakjiensis]|nr:hypothetical protein CLV49_0562 [Labedella gwakjiensis]